MKKIKVLIVEDSPVAQLLLVHLVNSDERLTVIGTANNGREALAFLKRHKPDVIVMDIHMPEMDGYETTRRIMETDPVPIVVCSASLNPAEVSNTFRALEAGAVAVVPKPVGLGHEHFESLTLKLLETIRLMSEVKVVKRWARTRRIELTAAPAAPKAPSLDPLANVNIVAVGASTGGPPVLQHILAALPPAFPVPILIVQHIATGFLLGLVEWLSQSTGVPIRIPHHGDELLPGHAYLAPDGYHLGIQPIGHAALSRRAPENGVRPSVAHLFRSVAETYGGAAVAVLLTGMGRDGAEELKLLKEQGAITIAQDAESSVVHGMPGHAIQIGAATHVMSPEEIASYLKRITNPTRNLDY